MTVTALLFFAFSLAAAVIHRRMPAKLKSAWLLVCSAGFIATWAWQFALLLVAFSWMNFALGKKSDPANPSSKRWARLGIVINILFLILIKYNNFYLPQFSAFLQSIGFLKSGSALQILLPVGLSFLVVQVISYLLDVANKRMKPELDFLRFCVYVMYFPKLLSGPVERARAFLPRLETPFPMDRALAERSAALILTGLVRKLIFANPLFNAIPETAFVTPLEYPGQYLVFWALAYAFALYNDFAGYTSIVRGVSLWFGIELAPNFNLPYFSRNFTEFWTRWHISLSAWLRDYIFFPLSRTLLKRISQRNHFVNFVLPPLLTLLVSGLWHGLAWSMLVWGGLHGLFLIMERVPSLWRPAQPLDEQPRIKQGLGRMVTFVLVTLAWVPFRMELPVALSYWRGMLHWSMPDFVGLAQTLTGSRLISGWSQFDLPSPILLLVLASAFALDLLERRAGSDDFLLSWPRWAQVLIVCILLFIAFLAIFSDTTAPFVYQGF